MEISQTLNAMWNDSAELMTFDWFSRIGFTAFLVLPIIGIALVIQFRGRRALVALGIWFWYLGWWFLQYAIDSWLNPGGPGAFLLMVLATIVAWAFVASEIRNQRKQAASKLAALPIAH